MIRIPGTVITTSNDESRFPNDQRWCHSILQSAETKDFVQRLSARDCSGHGQFSVSWYRAGDYSLPHNDLVGTNISTSVDTWPWCGI